MAGCKSGEPADTPNPTTGGTQEQPTAQSKTFTGVTDKDGSTVNVTVNYTALPDTVPGYMSTLETVVKNICVSVYVRGNLTINVISGGDDGFVLDGSEGSKTVNVRESWIANATELEMGKALSSKKVQWVAGYSTPRTLSFGTAENPCAVTVTSDDQFTADEWKTLCDDVVKAVNNAYITGAQASFEEVFASNQNAKVVLGNNFIYDWEVKDGVTKTVFIKTTSIKIVNYDDIIVYLQYDYPGHNE